MPKISLPFYKAAWLFFYLLALILLLYNSFSYFDPDFGWHLRLGEEIVKTGMVPTVNYSNYTLYGASFVDHEWLFNLTVYYIYNNFGYIVLSLLFCLLPLFALLILNYFLDNYFNISIKKYLWPLILFESLSLIAMAPHLGVRMQELTLLFFVFLLAIILHYIRNRKYFILWWLVPLFYLWANLHGGFLLGLGVLLVFIGVKIFERLFISKKVLSFLDSGSVFSWPEILLVMVFALLALVSTALTPYGLKLYSFLSSYGNVFYMNYISEWLPQWTAPYQYWQLSYISISILAACVWLNQMFKKKEKKLNLFFGALFIIFLFFAIKARRNFPFFFFVSFPFLFTVFLDNLWPANATQEKVRVNAGWVDIFSKFFIILTFIISGASLFLGVKFSNSPFNSFCEDRYRSSSNRLFYPCRALDFIKSNPDLNKQRLLNDFAWGGYLLWQYPEKQLFIDGRMPQANFKGHSILEEYFEFYDEKKTADKLDEYEIDLVLIRNSSVKSDSNFLDRYFMIGRKKGNKNNTLLTFLASSPNWELIYSDSLSVVYQRSEKNE